MGKGDRYRKVDLRRYRKNYDRIFRRKNGSDKKTAEAAG